MTLGNMIFLSLFLIPAVLKESCHFLLGNKSGNRRTANIRSIGYSDLFSLSKEDLTAVLSQFPAAKRLLEEKGRQILTKMGMLEESTETEEGEAENVETKVQKLESSLEVFQTKLARLMVEFESSNRKIQARVDRLGLVVAAMETQLPEDGGGGGERERGRREGVGKEAEWEREEADGEEERDSEMQVKKRGEGNEADDVAKEGDGESTKSGREETERLMEGDTSNLYDSDNQKEKGEPCREEGDDRHGKGDGAEFEHENGKEEKNTGRGKPEG